MDLLLKNKRVLVCAASKGLGYAVAKEFAAEGAELYICSRSEDGILAAKSELSSLTDQKIHASAIDLSNPKAINGFAQKVEDAMGGVDILVNNIGGPPPSTAAETNMEQWQKGFEQVFLSSTLLSQALLPKMRQNGFGRILTITSLSVLEPIDNLVVSTAMRAAVTTFSKTLAQEVAGDGVTVNTVMPGIILTARIENLRRAKAERDGTSLDHEMQQTIKQIPTGRLGQPEEFSALVAFLASPRASYITGMNFSVDGGQRKGW